MYLCIDTTTSEAGITLVGHGRLPIDPHHASEKILETIDQLIQKANIKLADLGGVFVIKGPGSFTGLRVGIAVANQFAHQLKIPIIGLRTDEWWSYRTDKKDFMYLQTMNKNEVYADGKIVPIEELSGEKLWLGQLSDDHRKKLPFDFKEVMDLRTPEETWAIVAQKDYNLQPTRPNGSAGRATYNLVEPYYGKEPTITKSKKRLHI